MSIIDRLQTLVRAEISALGRRPPREDVRRTLRDAASALEQVRATERELEARRRELTDEIDAREAIAARALERGDEVAARRELEARTALDDEARQTDAELREHKLRRDELRSALGDLRDAARRRKHRAATAVPNAGAPLSTLEPAALDRLGELEDRLDALEAETEAGWIDPLDDPESRRVEEEFRMLEAVEGPGRTTSADDALARLRNQMNRDDEH